MNGSWVCLRKTINSKEIVKAGYVFKSFQELSEIQADSPTGSKESVQLFLSVISSNQCRLHSIDIQAAFLHGNNIRVY